MDVGESVGLLFDEAATVTIRDAVPEPLVPLFEVVTHLGAGSTLVVIVLCLYWFGGAALRTRAFVVGTALGALGLSTGLKTGFAIERPNPELLAFAPETYGGFSFPSAHALGSAAILTMVAITLDVGTRWQRGLAAAALIGAVMLSRVVLGVHFVGDVLVGALIGLGFVAVMFLAYPRIGPKSAFGLAFGLGIVGLAVGSPGHSPLVVGTALGGLLASPALEAVDDDPMGTAIPAVAILAVPGFLLVHHSHVAFSIQSIQIVGYALVTALVLVAPVAGTFSKYRDALRYVGTAFTTRR